MARGRLGLERFAMQVARSRRLKQFLVDGIQRLVPAFDGGDDAVGVGGPDEWFRLIVVLGEEAVDGRLEVHDGAEDAALEASLRELGEEALHRVQPGARGRHEMEGEARVALEPAPDLGVLVGGVVVEDDVNHASGRHVGVDGIEEADEP